VNGHSTHVSARSENVSRPVSRVLSGGCPPRRPFLWGADCSAPRATNPGGGEDRAGRESCLSHPCRPYSVLLPVGFAVPLPLPAARCALTAPFHPCLCGSPRAGGLFSVALSLGSPPAAVSRHRRSLEPGLSSTALDGRKASSRGSGRPAGWQGGIRGVRGAGSRGCCPAHHQNEPPPP
jgi:hypothetical protein